MWGGRYELGLGECCGHYLGGAEKSRRVAVVLRDKGRVSCLGRVSCALPKNKLRVFCVCFDFVRDL